MVLLDLAELDSVFRGRWLWSTSSPALARFDRSDHMGDPALPLDESVRRLVAERTGRRPEGPVRLLTHLRYFGYVFNPVSFYYCFDRESKEVEAIVAEVNNTPWGEQHCYVLQPAPDGRWLRARCAKAMHVSPFHPMALEYGWRFSRESGPIQVAMALAEPDGPHMAPQFHALLTLRPVPITARSLATTLLQFPLMTVKVIVAIHWEALRLWLKRVPVFDPPVKHRTTETSP